MNGPLFLPCFCALLVGLLPAYGQAEPPDDCRIRLSDATARSGVAFRHTDGGGGQGYIVEGVAAGLAAFDYDGDGLMDVYFLNGSPLPGTKHEGPPPRHALYKNLGGFRFQDMTDQAGVANTGYGMGVTAGDYDDDGHPDLYLNNFGPNVLCHNNGRGAFTDATARAGVANGSKVGAGAAFLDIDGDGSLDLYVGNYVDFTFESHVPIVVGSRHLHAGPRHYRPVPDTLYRNRGDGVFSDASVSSGIAAVAGYSMGMVCGDFDDDGDTDIFTCNDESANFLFESDGRGQFKEVAVAAGAAYDFHGKENSNMGVDCGDYNRDGRLDLFTTDYQGEMPVLYRNLGGGLFEDATSAAAITHALFPHVTWGAGFADFDNDGDLDLYVACGHFDRIEEIDDRTSLRVRNFLLMNLGNGKFVDVSDRCGDGLAVVESSRGAAFDDLDNDGRIDVAVLNSNAPPTILRNESQTGNHWLQVRLRGVKTNRDGVGARVRVVAGDLAQIAEVHSGRSYQGHHGTRLHFGVGKRHRVDRIEVHWIGGGADVFTDLAADRLLVLTEGTGT